MRVTPQTMGGPRQVSGPLIQRACGPLYHAQVKQVGADFDWAVPEVLQ